MHALKKTMIGESYHMCVQLLFNIHVSFSDYGFKHSDGFVGPCIRDPDIELDDPCLTSSVASYMKSTGYRKIPGDVCTGGVEKTFEPQPFPCCESSPVPVAQSTVSTAALGVLFGLTLLGALVLIVVIAVLAM